MGEEAKIHYPCLRFPRPRFIEYKEVNAWGT